jgi:hypothetical protein
MSLTMHLRLKSGKKAMLERRLERSPQVVFTPPFSRGGLIWDHTLLKLLFGARDAHSLRREAVNANGKAENIRAATQGAETKPETA